MHHNIADLAHNAEILYQSGFGVVGYCARSMRYRRPQTNQIDVPFDQIQRRVSSRRIGLDITGEQLFGRNSAIPLDFLSKGSIHGCAPGVFGAASSRLNWPRGSGW